MNLFKVALLGLMFSSTVSAAEKLTVSKVDQNLYLEENRRVWIWTRYCYEIAYFTPAEYRRSKSGYEELYFIPTHTSCQIREISSHIPFDYEDTERR